MKELDRIRTILRGQKRMLRDDFKIKQIGLFGSFVRGEQKKNSDVDILVSFSATPGLFDFIRAENRLQNLLKRKVDLVMKDSLKPSIGKIVMKEVVYI